MSAVQLVRHPDNELPGDDAPPGAFSWHLCQAGVRRVYYRCPGCHLWAGIPVPPAPLPAWQWDGNEDTPTLSPSLLCGCGWHGWMRAGQLVVV